MRFKLHIAFLLTAFTLISCTVDPTVSPVVNTNELSEIVPESWPQPVYNFANNKISAEKFTLGRALFYEPMLSIDNTISCGSCHQRGAAFANAGHRVSHGVTKDGVELEGIRNAPGLFNLTWHPYFMHDGGINHIEVQPLGPITNPIEMAETMPHVIAKLQASAKYKTLFKNAFDSDEITGERMLKALAQFMGLMYSYNSKYDYVKRGKSKFTEPEKKGYDLFLTNCNACHAEPLFSDFKFRSNGLPARAGVVDHGHEIISRDTLDRNKFKTPSLRNLEATAPYMHNGCFETLEECLDHYTNGIDALANPDPLLRNRLVLNADEKRFIIAFLNTLNDREFINNKRFDEEK